MFDIQLLLSDDKDDANLKLLLDDYFQVEYIDFENIYNKYKDILPHWKIFKLCKIPQIFVLFFQKFDIQNDIKNNIKVFFLIEILNIKD